MKARTGARSLHSIFSATVARTKELEETKAGGTTLPVTKISNCCLLKILSAQSLALERAHPLVT